MTAESTAVCDQQTARGRRSRARGVQRLGRATDRRPVARQEAGGRLCAVRADLPGLRQRHRRCVRPRIPGFSPGGLGPHLTSSGSPRGLSSGFPFARRVLPRRPPSPGFPSSGVLRLFPSAVARVPVPLSVSLRVPFPWATFTIALPPRGSAGVGPGGGRGEGHQLAATPRLNRRDPSRTTDGQPLGAMGCRYRIACYERPRAQDTAAPEPPRSAARRAFSLTPVSRSVTTGRRDALGRRTPTCTSATRDRTGWLHRGLPGGAAVCRSPGLLDDPGRAPVHPLRRDPRSAPPPGATVPCGRHDGLGTSQRAAAIQKDPVGGRSGHSR